MLEVTWTEASNIAGWSDLIPDSWCRFEGKQRAMRHCSRSPKGKMSAYGFCDVTVKGSTVVLDYRKYKPLNDRYDWEDGVMYIRFADASRKTPRQVGWRTADRKEQKALASAAFVATEFDDDWAQNENLEGSVILSHHILRERNPAKIKDKKARVLATTGELRCEACAFSFAEEYPNLDDGYCEVHHLDHLRQGPRRTELDRLAILCSNCHRMIHKMPSGTTIAQFKSNILRNPKRGSKNVRKERE